jgi:putative ABC transport system ATP-binding protein
MQSLLTAKKVTKVFNPKKNSEVRAVTNVSLLLKRGEIVMIMGPSGSGKTTLLTMLGGLLKPSSGEIIFDGESIHTLNFGKLTNIRRHKIGFIFQSFNLLQNLNALENVMIAGFDINNPKERSKEILSRLGLADKLYAKPNDLSGGERQRVAIARALINNPPLILADEPPANLDSTMGHQVMQLLCSIGCEEGKSIVIVSHDERIKDVAHRVLYIEDGLLKREEKGNHDKVCLMRSHAAS